MCSKHVPFTKVILLNHDYFFTRGCYKKYCAEFYIYNKLYWYHVNKFYKAYAYK